MIPRRKYLLIGTSAILGAGAGCLDDSSDQDEGATPPPDIDDDDDNGEDNGNDEDDDDGRPPEPEPLDAPLDSQDVLPAHIEQVESADSITQHGVITREEDVGNYTEIIETKGTEYTLIKDGDKRLYESSQIYEDFEFDIIQTSDGDTYARIEENGSVSYEAGNCETVSDASVNNPMFADGFDEFVDSVSYTHDSTSWEDDRWIMVYTSESLDLVDDEFAEEFTGGNLTSFSSTLMINEDGLIEQLVTQISTDDESSPEFFNTLYSREGSISEPDWLSEAEIAVDDPSC